MSEPLPGVATAQRPAGSYGRTLLRICRWYAAAGAILFVALVAMSVVSIVGRKLVAAPVPGDVEVLQMAAAVGAAAFFAYCHLIGGDVKVDFFTARAGSRTVHLLDAFGSLLTGLVGAVLAWRSGAGALAVQSYEETSMILAWPLWVPQMLMVPGFALLGLAGFYKMQTHLRLAFPGAVA